MSAEWAAVYITAVGVLGTIFNIWLTNRIRGDILGVKFWAVSTFIAKDDMPIYGLLREALQRHESEARLRGVNNATG